MDVSEPRWLDDEEKRTWLALVGATTRLFDALDRDLEGVEGLTRGDYGILAELSEAPDRRLRMSELAMAALESKSGLSHHIGRLERDGLVRREACPTDRRGLYAALTDKGWEVLVKAAPTHVESVRRRVFDHLDREQVRVLGDALGAIEAHLRGVTSDTSG